MRASKYAWFNGYLAPLDAAAPSVASNTLHLGIAVFDGIMAYWNNDHWYLHRGREHMERFYASARKMDLAPGWSAAQMEEGTLELLDTLPQRTHYIRPIAYRRSPDVFFQVDDGAHSICIFAVPVGVDMNRAYSCQLSSVQRVHCKAIPATWKVSGAYANSFQAERQARAAGFDTGIMLDTKGRIAEAATANVFFLRDNVVRTPRLDGDVFPGITRSIVIDIARAAGLTVREEEVRPRDLASFEAALLCGTLSEVRPIVRIGAHRYDSERNAHVKQIVDAYLAITRQ